MDIDVREADLEVGWSIGQKKGVATCPTMVLMRPCKDLC